MEESTGRIHSHRPWLVVTVITGAIIWVLLLTAVVFGFYLIQPPHTAEADLDPQLFTVSSGESLTSVAERLYQARLIRSPLVLRILAKVRGEEAVIQAGSFELPSGITMTNILELLVGGAHDLIRITIPEGWTINKIAAYLEAQGVTSAAAFKIATASPRLMESFGIVADSAEGYLFPETYYFPRSYNPEFVARHMIETFFERFKQVQPEYMPALSAQLHDTVILASIIEREYRVESEAAIIASVFYNRLSRDLGLESCATIEYIITELQGKEHPDRILHSDLKIDSPYNTYRWHGLPPGPIANPGMTALLAALFPETTDYWYFVVKDPVTGTHHFSTDLTEHSKAKFFYLKGVAEPPSRADS